MDLKEAVEILRTEVKTAVRETVNGKIDDLRKTNDEGMAAINKKIESHNAAHEKDMADMKPIISAYQGGKVLGELVKWLASVGIAYLIIKGWVRIPFE